MMRQVVFMLMALMLVTGMATAQEKKAVISVDNAVHDFGKFKESDGNVTHTFVVTNQGEAPLVITRVIASCGCTTPVWTKEPIAPGKTGKVDVTYNPVNRPGPFSKTISVYSNGKVGSFILSIRGDVTGK